MSNTSSKPPTSGPKRPEELFQAVGKQAAGAEEAEARRAFRQRMARIRVEGPLPQEPYKLPPLPEGSSPGPKPQRVLIIGDSHAQPGVPNWRYEWLGRFIVERRPDVVVDIGDWWDMPSLCRYDREKAPRVYYSQDYHADIDAGVDAMERVRWQLQQASGGYQPRLVRCLGNHEYRIQRLQMAEPHLAEAVGTHDLLSAEFGWEEYPLGEPVRIGGVNYSHYVCRPGTDKPISSKVSVARAIVQDYHDSFVVGHNHGLDYYDTMGPGGQRLIGLSVGCFFGHSPTYAGPLDPKRWWRGLVELEGLDVRCYGWEYLQRWFS